MSTEYPNTHTHARIKTTKVQQQKDATKMTHPKALALLTKILVTDSKTQKELTLYMLIPISISLTNLKNFL